MAAVSSGCAFGVRHRYDDAVPALEASGSGLLVVAVTDQRPYILDGDKTPNFVGLSRAGYGNPFDVLTASGQPLAQDVATSLCASLSRRGWQCMPSVSVGADLVSARDSALEAAKRNGARRVLFLTVRQWKADTYTNTSLYFDLSAEVLDSTGSVLAQNRLQGREEVEGSFLNPPSAARENVPVAYRKKIEELLNTPRIADGLQSTGPASPGAGAQ